MRGPWRFGRGFTLVEMLVVLMIIGFVSVVLLTGFERVLDIRLRLAAFLDGVEAPVLVADWFRTTVGGLVAEPGDGPDRFAGGPRGLSGLSVMPLAAAAGVPTRIAWSVAYNSETGRSELRYRNSGDQWMIIASWPGDSGGLRYCGPELVCYATWPPDKDAAQLPRVIRLDAVKGGDPWPILASPQSDRAPLEIGAVRR